ncbi:MAG: hypothetical protein E7562_00155 [Ruminococcaceae bacterium]|nr:hypothetical protein [Oscillospiraceae bacterium]
MKFKRICAFLLQLVIIASCIFTVNADVTSSDAANTSSGSSLELHVDKITCEISVFNKADGRVWTLNPINPVEDEYTTSATINDIRSQLIVSYYDKENKKAVIGSYISSVRRGSFKITESKNKIRIDYDFSRPHEQFSIPVEYSVEDNTLKVTVLINEIKEYGKVKIGEISLLPYFLHAQSSDNGYIFIPDGSGALIDLSTVNSASAAYSQRIYGRDGALSYYYDEGSEHDAMLPVFGINKNGAGVLAVVSGNESAASICAECSGKSSSYSRAYASFIYRVYDTVTISGSDWRYKEYTAQAENYEKKNFAVEYLFLQNNTYVDMALQYREYLKKNGALDKNLTEAKLISGAVKAYGATETKDSFLGIPYTKTVAATTFDDVSKLLSKLKPSSQKRLAVFLEDFDEDSMGNDYPESDSWVSSLGDDDDFEALVKKYGKNCRFFRTSDVIYERCSSFLWFFQSNYAQMVSKDYITKNTYSNVTYAQEVSDWYALNSKKLIDNSKEFFEEIADMDKKVGVALDGMGNTLYGDYNADSFVPREEMLKKFRSVIKNAKKEKLDVAVQGGNAYAIGLVDTYYDYPVTSSNLIISSKSVPFAQIVLHGYANMVSLPLNLQTDSETAFLNCMEYGMAPMFAVTGMSNKQLRRTDYKSLYSTQYSKLLPQISQKINKSADLFHEIGTSCITAHSNDGNLGITVYENGITVVVNYADNEVEYNGLKVASKDFEIIK